MVAGGWLQQRRATREANKAYERQSKADYMRIKERELAVREHEADNRELEMRIRAYEKGYDAEQA